MAKAKSLETAFEELEALAAKMEDRDLPLEDPAILQWCD